MHEPFEPWPPGSGVMQLPDGRRIRGRGLRHPIPAGPAPEHGYYFTGRRPPTVGWDSTWVPWPDFLVPVRWRETRQVLVRAYDEAGRRRVEFACGGGRGRTGTALACVTTLAGLAPPEAIDYVRAHYDRRAVETPWQRAFVRWFARG